jgi:hypothetical protein
MSQTDFQAIRARLHASWLASDDYVRDRAAEKEREWREAPSRAAIARMEVKYQARRLAKAAPPAAPPLVTSGRGWRVSEPPRRPHAELEALAKQIWDVAFLGLPWVGYRVRWGDLRPLAAAGLAVPTAKLIVICEHYYSGHGEYPNGESLVRTLTHELVHATHGNEPDAHGPRFQDTLQRVMDYMNPAPKPAPAPARSPVRPVPPSPPRTPDELVAAQKGKRLDGRPVEWAGSGAWEFRG